MAQKKTEQSENETRQLTGYSVEPTGAVALVGTAQFMDALAESVKALRLMTPTPENADACSDTLTKFNKSVKSYKAQIAFVRSSYDKPLDAAMEAVEKAVADAEKAGKDYQKLTLASKKEAYKAKAQKEYAAFASVASEGSPIPAFASFYEDGWYDLPQDDLRAKIADKLKSLLGKGKEEDPLATATFSVTGSDAIGKARKALDAAGVKYVEASSAVNW